MYQDRKPKFMQVGELYVRHDRSIVISRYHDGGYRLGVKQTARDENNGEYSFFLKGAIVVPDNQKLREMALQLLDIASMEDEY